MDNRTTTTQYWWLLALAGVVSIMFGLAALFWPGLTLLILVWLFGWYAIIYGVVSLIGMFRAIAGHTTWWTHLLVGLLSLAAGIYVLANPLLSTVTLLFVIAFWAIALGLVEIAAGLVHAQFLAVITGVIAILFGFVLLANPALGALAAIWTIGVFAIARGIVQLVGAVRTPTGTGLAG